MDAVYAVILAAGKGTRMKSDLAKVLHPLAGRPLLSHVLDALAPLKPTRTVVVVGHQADQVRELCTAPGIETVVQAEQLGTGHAVEQAKEVLEHESGQTLILCGDVPLIRTETLQALLEGSTAQGARASVLSAIAEDATGYGRILRNEANQVVGIVEQKDATEEQRKIREYNTGTYCFDNSLLWPALRRLDQQNAQGEFYLTDVIEILVRDGHRVEGVVCPDEREVQGVNTVDDLERAGADRADLRRERA